MTRLFLGETRWNKRGWKHLSSGSYEWIWVNVDPGQGIINACARTGKETQWKQWTERVCRQENGSRASIDFLVWSVISWDIYKCVLSTIWFCESCSLCIVTINNCVQEFQGPDSSSVSDLRLKHSVFLCRAGRAAEAEMWLGTIIPLWIRGT